MMLLASWLRNWKRSATAAHRHTQTFHRQRSGFRPQLEALEGRWVPSTVTVTNINDSGAGSLRAAIAAANSGDIIDFDSGLAGQTITLTSGELAINKSLSIEGTPGSPEAIGWSLDRVLHITDAVNVTLDNLRIEYGRNDEGAGIYNNGGTLTINDSSVSNNTTNSPDYNGGGIYNNGGTVTINRSDLSGNDARFLYLSGGGNGGGIYNAGGTVTINDSSLIGNIAYYYGGGIYNAGGTVLVRNSGVMTNYAYSGGAGIYNTASGIATVENSSNITGNMVVSSYGEDVYNGGVVYLDGASTISILHGNAAILLDPSAPQLQISNATVTEGNTGTVAAQFTVTLAASSTKTVTVAYVTGDGTANAGSDYQAAGGTLTFAPGDTKKIITVLVNGDRLGEPNETFIVNLSSATNATIIIGQAVGTIVDDEPHVSITDVSKLEGKKGQTTLFTFTITLSTTYDQPVTMSYHTVDGTTKSGDDYVAKTGTLTFSPGETTKTITIEVKGDSKKEASETFYVDLYGLSSNALFTKNRGIGTILNDD
jgi:hypothetical protein